MSEINKGFIQSGGTINAGAIAGGENATASNYDSDSSSPSKLQEILLKLKQLEGQLEKRKAELPEGDEVLSAATVIKNQLQSERPNKLTILSVLDGIKRSVEPVADIASIVEGIRSAIAAFFGN